MKQIDITTQLLKIPINRHSPNITKSCQVKHIILYTAVENYAIVESTIGNLISLPLYLKATLLL